MGNFEPRKHLIALKGKMYLETRYRVQWFREDHPRGSITTEVISYDPVLVKAFVKDEDGLILATAHAGAKETANSVWSGRAIEKAETAAIGRALGHGGWGTQFASEGEPHDEVQSGHLADSPLERPGQATKRYGGGATEDMRHRDVASRFIQDWRGQSLSDTEVLSALGVTRLSDWTKGRRAADDAVNAWLMGKVERESDEVPKSDPVLKEGADLGASVRKAEPQKKAS